MPGVLLIEESVGWTTVAYLALSVFLVFLNGFFVAAEFAIIKVRATRIDEMAEAGNIRARLTQHVVTHLNVYLSACQFGVTIASLGLGWLGEPAFAVLLRPVLGAIAGLFGGEASETVVHTVSVALAFLTISGLHIVVGEQAPKALAIRRAESVALWVAPPLRLFNLLTYPMVWVLNWAANVVVSAVGMPTGDGGHEEEAHSERELKRIVAMSHRQGLIQESEKAFIERAFEFHDLIARDIMVPRTEMVCLYLDLPIEENLKTIRECRYTRYPVLRTRNSDQVLGVVNVKDLVTPAELPRTSQDLSRLFRPVPYVPETAPIARLLRRFQAGPSHLAMVVDEYGGIVGLITLEDVLEEIVGPIQDEYDIGEERAAVRDTGGARIILGRTPVDVASKELGIETPDARANTIAGYVLQTLGRIPKPGDTLRLGSYRVEVVEMDSNRIELLRFTPAEAPEAPPREVPAPEPAASEVAATKPPEAPTGTDGGVAHGAAAEHSRA